MRSYMYVQVCYVIISLLSFNISRKQATSYKTFWIDLPKLLRPLE